MAAYERITGRLNSVAAVISSSEHFRFVAKYQRHDSAITSLDWNTDCLAVIVRSENGFKVKELERGRANFSFDWEVKYI